MTDESSVGKKELTKHLVFDLEASKLHNVTSENAVSGATAILDGKWCTQVRERV